MEDTDPLTAPGTYVLGLLFLSFRRSCVHLICSEHTLVISTPLASGMRPFDLCPPFRHYLETPTHNADADALVQRRKTARDRPVRAPVFELEEA